MRRSLGALLSLLIALSPLTALAQSSPFPLVRTVNMQTAAAATGNGTALPVSQLSTVAFQVTGTFTGVTIVFEGSLGTSTYVALPSCSGTSAGSTVSTTGLWYCPVTGLAGVRARISAWSTGTVTVVGSGTSSAAAPAGYTGGAAAQIQSYSQPLNPTAMAAVTGNLVIGPSAEQTFTVTGLTTGQTTFINGPAPTALCPPVHNRVSAANTLSVSFLQLTSAVCTPATGVYQIVAAPATGLSTAGQPYIQTFNPTAMTALTGSAQVAFSAEQNFTVTGLTTGNRVFVNGPAPTALCPPAHWRVSSANTLTGAFVQLTAAVCTPATGTYQVVAL